MATRQRGNAVLISAILVFALTMAALGVSRMLVNWTRQASGQKYLLGAQAFSMAEAALDEDISTLPDTAAPAPPSSRANVDFQAAATLPTISGWTLSTATASTEWSGPNGGPFDATASVTYAGTAGGSQWTVNRQLVVSVATGSTWKVSITGPAGVGP